MSNRIIIPRTKIEIGTSPVIFLVGPVSHAGGWQNRAIDIIRKRNTEAYIAVPDYGSVLDIKYTADSEKSTDAFNRQLEWEQHYLEIAENQGAILFWLPRQTGQMPFLPESGYPRTYARDTRPETGGWGWGLLRFNPKAHVAIGGEEEFDGLDIIRRNFTRYAPQIPFRNKLEDVCTDALKFL